MSMFDRLRSFFGGSPTPGAGANGASDGEMEMIPCHEALRLVHEYLDGELEGVSEDQVQKHFDVCQQCYQHLHLESVFRDTVRRAAGTQTAPPELKAKLSEILAEADAEG